MKAEEETAMPQQQETMMESHSASGIKPEDSLSQTSTSLLPPGSPGVSSEQKLDSCNIAGPNAPPPEVKTSSQAMLRPDQAVAPLHPLHQASAGAPMSQGIPNQGVSSHVGADVGNGGGVGNVPEFELARRLGVRFDSSNAAWVARWTDPQNDRKKSRWFSVAKYGNAPARRLAIQACLHNMKPTDFPSLRDLQDVLSTFGSAGSGPNGDGGYLVPGGDMGGAVPSNMAGVVRGTGVDGHHMGQKLGAQFGAHHLLHPHHHNPFGMSGLPNPMAGYMAGGMPGMGMHPGNPMGMFVQGVPQHHATQGMAPQQAVQEESEGTDANGQPIMKSQYAQNDATTDPNAPVKTQFDQTTTAASSVASPSANAGCKTEGVSVRSSDPAFLQSLSANPIPATPPESASSSSSRFVLSGDSSSQESSDIETRSIGSHSDDEDEDDDAKEGEDGERSLKRKKRKLDEAGHAANSGTPIQAPVPNANMFGMNLYNQASSQQQQQQGLHNAMAAAAAAGHIHPSYYSMYGGYPHSQQMLMHQMNGSGGGQPGLHGLPFVFQPSMLPMLHPHFQAQHAAAAAAAGFLPHSHMQSNMDMQNAQNLQYHHLIKPPSPNAGLYLPPGAGRYGQSGVSGDSPQSQSAGDSPTSATSPGGDTGPGGSGSVGPYKRHHGHSGSQSSSSSGGTGGGGASSTSAKMTCERGLHYSKCYQGSQECWIAVWNTKGGRIMHEAFDVGDLGYEGAKQKAREARDAAHSNNVAVTENSRPSWKSHSNTGIPHVSLDSQQLRFRAHKFGRRLCRSFSFGRRRGSYASRESAFDAAVLWLIQTPTEEEIAAVSGCSSKIDESM